MQAARRIETMSRDDKVALLSLIGERDRRRAMRKWLTYYPDSGPFRRNLYPKHIAFFAAGKRYQQRLMMAANRVGKTEGIGAYEVSLHLTGDYPDWWPGKRFSKPTKGWVAGDTRQTVRDILAEKLLGLKFGDRDDLGKRIRTSLNEGLPITEVVKGSVAANAGLKAGLLVTRINETDIGSLDDVGLALEHVRPGDVVALSLLSIDDSGASLLAQSFVVQLTVE